MRANDLTNPRRKGNQPTECPACYQSKVIYPVGWTLGGEPLYRCNNEWHVKTIRRADLMRGLVDD